MRDDWAIPMGGQVGTRCGICGVLMSDEVGPRLNCGGDCAACLGEVGDPDILVSLADYYLRRVCTDRPRPSLALVPLVNRDPGDETDYVEGLA